MLKENHKISPSLLLFLFIGISFFILRLGYMKNLGYIDSHYLLNFKHILF